MTAEERAADIVLALRPASNSGPVYGPEDDAYVAKHIREAEAAAELRGKRAAFEEMAAWCAGLVAHQHHRLEHWSDDRNYARGETFLDCARRCQERARELGGKHG